MARRARQRWQRDWYQIDVDTIRGTLILVSVVVGVFAVWKGWDEIEERYQRGKYRRVLHEAHALQRSVRDHQTLTEYADYADEVASARASLQTAEEYAVDSRWEPALRSAERGRLLLATVLRGLERAETNGQAQFISVTNGVEFRRGERGEWQRAFSRGVLYAGDYVKTTDGASAEIMGVDGTVYTVREDTVILVGRSTGLAGGKPQRSIALNHGWVNLSTAKAASTVTTPDAEAEVDEDSSALVAYDGSRRVGRFAAYSGSMQVASSGGQRRSLRKLEQVVQTGTALSEKRSLPAAPLQLDPNDNLELRLGVDEELMLSWQPVPGARRYALQVARNRLFARNIIDIDDRETTWARLGLLGDGTFVWRVAAIGREGVIGPWSTPRRFKVRPAPSDLRVETEADVELESEQAPAAAAASGAI